MRCLIAAAIFLCAGALCAKELDDILNNLEFLQQYRVIKNMPLIPEYAVAAASAPVTAAKTAKGKKGKKGIQSK